VLRADHVTFHVNVERTYIYRLVMRPGWGGKDKKVHIRIHYTVMAVQYT
jgi:hypothetical protein